MRLVIFNLYYFEMSFGIFLLVGNERKCSRLTLSGTLYPSPNLTPTPLPESLAIFFRRHALSPLFLSYHQKQNNSYLPITLIARRDTIGPLDGGSVGSCCRRCCCRCCSRLSFTVLRPSYLACRACGSGSNWIALVSVGSPQPFSIAVSFASSARLLI